MFDDEATIKKVEKINRYWHILTESGTGFAFPSRYAQRSKAPKVGDSIVCHTHQGSLIRGVTLRGELLYYKSDEELEIERQEWRQKNDEEKKKRFKKERKQMNEDYDALPIEFQRRVSWFRAHNPDFRWDLEGYELSVCKDAALIVSTLKTEAAIKRFANASWKKQQEMVPGLYDGHSGNSFSCAVRLARFYVQNPLWVILEHGALTPLIGCKEYGCAHPRPQDVMDSLPEEAAA